MGRAGCTQCDLSPRPGVQWVFNCSGILDFLIHLTVYYKLYDDDKKQMTPCRTANTEGPFVGRVDTCQIPTPHTLGALAKNICEKENRTYGLDWDNDNAGGSMLFKAVNSSEAYDLNGSADLLGAERPGSTPQEPVLLKVWYEGELGRRGWSRSDSGA
jgi:hypothetical protein